jgi:hypothetical protein
MSLIVDDAAQRGRIAAHHDVPSSPVVTSSSGEEET